METRECVVCGLVGCWLFRVGAASVEEEDGDASTVVVHPDLGLETVATAALAVGLVGAASPFAPCRRFSSSIAVSCLRSSNLPRIKAVRNVAVSLALEKMPPSAAMPQCLSVVSVCLPCGSIP